MPIKNTKEADLRPLNTCRDLLVLRFENVQNDGDAVFIILSNDSLVSISSVRLNVATFFCGRLSRLVILQINRLWA